MLLIHPSDLEHHIYSGISCAINLESSKILCHFWSNMCIFVIVIFKIAKDCLLTEQDGSRITQLLVCSVGCYYAKNGPIHRKMVVDCTIVITSMDDPLFQTRNEE